MIFKYDTFTNYGRPVNVITVAKPPIYSPRGQIVARRDMIVIEAEVVDVSQAALKTKIQAVEAAYIDNNGHDAILYHLDGVTESAHKLDNSSSVSGVKVMDFRWTDKSNVEYALRRSYSVTLQADYDPAVVPVYVSYEDSLSFQGNAGPRVVWDELITGSPVSHQTAAVTLRRMTHSGRAVGLYARPLPPSPLDSGSLINQDEGVSKFGPVVIDGRLQNYGIAWNYQHAGNVNFAALSPTTN